MTTTTLSARSLYDLSSDLRTFISIWDRHKRCPVPLVDLLLENDLYSQSEAARWCVETPDRLIYGIDDPAGRKREECGPYPKRIKWEYRRSAWTWFPLLGMSGFASHVPEDHIDFTYGNREKSKSPTTAILWLLDNWRL